MSSGSFRYQRRRTRPATPQTVPANWSGAHSLQNLLTYPEQYLNNRVATALRWNTYVINPSKVQMEAQRSSSSRYIFTISPTCIQCLPNTSHLLDMSSTCHGKLRGSEAYWNLPLQAILYITFSHGPALPDAGVPPVHTFSDRLRKMIRLTQFSLIGNAFDCVRSSQAIIHVHHLG